MDNRRHREIILLEELKKHKRLDVKDALKLLHVSEATLRRLFARLESEKKLIRTHGGIQILPQLFENYSYMESARQNIESKSQIGKAAVKLIRNGDRIFLDAGTSILYMAEELGLSLRIGTLKNITVVTNSLALGGNVAQYCETILAGGRIRPERNDVCGAMTCEIISKYNFDKVFFGVDAISADGRLMTTDSETAMVNTAFLGSANEKIVLADAEKFDRTSFVSFSSLAQVDRVITDSRLSTEMSSRYSGFLAHLEIVRLPN